MKKFIKIIKKELQLEQKLYNSKKVEIKSRKIIKFQKYSSRVAFRNDYICHTDDPEELAKITLSFMEKKGLKIRPGKVFINNFYKVVDTISKFYKRGNLSTDVFNIFSEERVKYFSKKEDYVAFVNTLEEFNILKYKRGYTYGYNYKLGEYRMLIKPTTVFLSDPKPVSPISKGHHKVMQNCSLTTYEGRPLDPYNRIVDRFGRLYNQVTLLPSNERNKLEYTDPETGEKTKFVEFDIKSCAYSLLPAINPEVLRNFGFNITEEEEEQFNALRINEANQAIWRQSLIDGEFYKRLYKLSGTKLSYEKFKEILMLILNGDADDGRGKPKVILEHLSRNGYYLLQLKDWITNLRCLSNQKKTVRIHKVLMRMETSYIFDYIVNNTDIPMITIHDAILVPEKYASTATGEYQNINKYFEEQTEKFNSDYNADVIIKWELEGTVKDYDKKVVEKQQLGESKQSLEPPKKEEKRSEKPKSREELRLAGTPFAHIFVEVDRDIFNDLSSTFPKKGKQKEPPGVKYDRSDTQNNRDLIF